MKGRNWRKGDSEGDWRRCAHSTVGVLEGCLWVVQIISLHFPPPEIVTAPITTTNSTSVFATFSDFGNSLRGKSAKTLWDSVSGNRREIELGEQCWSWIS